MSIKHIVITGSTRGIGYGLAEAFLSRGCSVTVSGRGEEAVEKAVAGLLSGHAAGDVLGVTCDVTIPEQVQDLWDKSIDRFGKVDIWVNNAGSSGEQGLVWELSAQGSAGLHPGKHLGYSIRRPGGNEGHAGTGFWSDLLNIIADTVENVTP